jgi:outer membrane biosynthesis protein TonB
MRDRRAERRAARRTVLLALLVSLLAHLTGVFTVAWVLFVKPPELREVLPEELTVTLVEPPTAQKPKFVDTSAPEAAPPENAMFESDRNTAAASPDAAAGGAALPTQEGREQPFLELEEQQLALAKPDAAPPAPETPPSPAASQAAQPAPQLPEQREEIKPKPEDDGAIIASNVAREPEKKTKQPPPPAVPASRPSYRPMTRATRLSGSIDSRGKASVSALATPLGRYRKAISDAVGSSWYQHIGSRMDMFSFGTIKVLFTIEKDGKARNPRVLSNTSNESFEIVTIESIRAAEIPPIPPDVLPVLDGGRIEIDFGFSIISY